MFVYALGPIDYWGGWTQLKDLMIQDEDPWVYASSLVRRWDLAKEMARHLIWEGDVIQGPYVSPIPDTGGDVVCEFLIGWKQQNNGTTFIASPFKLPWLEEEACAWVDDKGNSGGWCKPSKAKRKQAT